MLTIDINVRAGMALVCDGTNLTGVRYVTIGQCNPSKRLEGLDPSIIDLAHKVAETVQKKYRPTFTTPPGWQRTTKFDTTENNQ